MNAETWASVAAAVAVEFEKSKEGTDSIARECSILAKALCGTAQCWGRIADGSGMIQECEKGV